MTKNKASVMAGIGNSISIFGKLNHFSKIPGVTVALNTQIY
jgi:hypothetical protein